MKQKLSKFLFISFILDIIYLIYSASYWSGVAGSGASAAEQVGSGLATAIVMPHLVFTALAVIFNGLGLFMKKRGFALTGAILYTVALVLFPIYFMFVIIQMILSYIGFAKMKKEAKQTQQNADEIRKKLQELLTPRAFYIYSFTGASCQGAYFFCPNPADLFPISL